MGKNSQIGSFSYHVFTENAYTRVNLSDDIPEMNQIFTENTEERRYHVFTENAK